MKIYYHIINNTFYLESMKGEYGAEWPKVKDLVEVSQEAWETFAMSSPPLGKIRGFVDGGVGWVDRTAISNDTDWALSEMERVRGELEKVQDSDPKATGTVSMWRDYRKTLRAWMGRPDSEGDTPPPQAPDSNK
jgi:hypothetical protein